MPLETHIPQIDDRRYDDIMTEVRTRIARYTPEWTPVWTDLNDNDPGITITQVMAWLSEMLMHRMAQVPPLNYLKFLQLIGMELNPAEPAQAEITFPLKNTSVVPTFVIIPERTQVSAEASDDGSPIVFETTRALVAVRATLDAIQAFDGFSFTDLSTENIDGRQGFLPLGALAGDDSALMLGFSDADPFPGNVELNLTFWARQKGASTNALQCGMPATAIWGPAKIVWEYLNGSEWKTMSLLKDETYAFTRSGHIHLKTPATGALQKTSLGAVSDPRYWIRGRVTKSQYERVPELLAIRTNTVAVEQAETIRDEVLGGSNGRRDQVFRLTNTPVIKDSLQVEVDEGSGHETWTRVDDFFGSAPNDHHYTLNRTSGEIRCGDGLSGSIPVANVNNPTANMVARLYRVGGGKRGNVPAKSIKTLLTVIAGVDDNKVENLMAAHSGRDEETLDAAKKRAPRLLKSRCRAVTAEDFELLAMQASTIKRAKALPLFHPSFLGVKVPGVVTVIVVPEADDTTPNPLPSEGTLRTVCAYLDVRRLLTTELYVIKPTYQRVLVRAEIVVQDEADLAEVKPAIEQAIGKYFHPLTGGEDGFGWPFGGTVYFSRVYQRVFTVPGVQSITRLTIVVDGTEAPECQDVPIEEHALTYSTDHNISVQYRFDE